MSHDSCRQLESVTIAPLLGGVIPSSLAESPMISDVLNKILTPELDIYIAVPSGMGVVERWPSLQGGAALYYRLGRGYQETALSLQDEAIMYAVVRPEIEFLQLDESSLRALRTQSKGAIHWFRGGALYARNGGGLFKRSGPSLMCVRPLDWIRRNLPPDGVPGEHSPSMALTHDGECEVKFDLANVFTDRGRIDELREAIGRAQSAEDLYRLSEGMPALHHLYRVARQYSIPLSSLSRTRARRDKERLDELRNKAKESLRNYGPPFDTRICVDHCFRIIDPMHVWARGAGATSFEGAYHKLLAQDAKFRDEASLSVALRVLIMVARNALANRDREDRHWSKSHGSVAGELEKMGFKGNDLTTILAKILMEKYKKPEIPVVTPKL